MKTVYTLHRIIWTSVSSGFWKLIYLCQSLMAKVCSPDIYRAHYFQCTLVAYLYVRCRIWWIKICSYSWGCCIIHTSLQTTFFANTIITYLFSLLELNHSQIFCPAAQLVAHVGNACDDVLLRPTSSWMSPTTRSPEVKQVKLSLGLWLRLITKTSAWYELKS